MKISTGFALEFHMQNHAYHDLFRFGNSNFSDVSAHEHFKYAIEPFVKMAFGFDGIKRRGTEESVKAMNAMSFKKKKNVVPKIIRNDYCFLIE